MKVTVKIDDEAVFKMFKMQEANARNAAPVMKSIKQDMDTRREIGARLQQDPEGKPWKPLSPVTLNKRKTRKISPTSSTRILEDIGRLRASFASKSDHNSAQIGTNLKYAPTQQFGAKKGQYGRTKNGRPIPWGDIPARPMIGITAKQRAGYLRRINNWILKGEK